MVTPAETAWAFLLPCSIATVGAVLVLGPPLGHALLEPGGQEILPGYGVRPEPVEHARYALAALGAIALAALVALSRRRPPYLIPSTTTVLVRTGHATACLFVLGCLLAQYGVIPGAERLPWTGPTRYFTPLTLAVAAAAAVLTMLGSRTCSRARLAEMTRETRARRAICLVVAIALVADWLLRAVNSDGTIGSGGTPLSLMPWELSESFAVLDGRTPLADFHAMYGHLLAYPVAGSLAAFGDSVATWTVTMTVLSGLAMLAVYALLRRVAGSLLALLLFAPFVAISFWVIDAAGATISLSTLFSVWPLRYGGPYVLAWLTARHLDGARPRRPEVLFFVAGLVLINNLEFGLPALAATVAAIALCPATGRLRFAVGACAGLASSALLVTLVTLLHGGHLPDPAMPLEFPRLFSEGWGLEPMPAIGLHLAVFATFAAAIVTAVVQAAEGAAERCTLAGMLAWAGTFGLGAGTYYLGRSDPGNLIPLFSAWSFALALLAVAALDPRMRGARRRPTVPQLMVVFGVALGIGMLAQTPTPWSQFERLQRDAAERPLEQSAATAFVKRYTTPGQRVAIFAPLGFRIAHELRLTNVSPYVTAEAIGTTTQLRTAVDALRAASVRTSFVKAPGSEAGGIGDQSGNVPIIVATLEDAGFAVVGQEPALIAMRR